jgi:hypothetical protein
MNDLMKNPPTFLRVDVTEDDIISGVQNHCYLCPVAIAIRRALGLPYISPDLLAVQEVNQIYFGPVIVNFFTWLLYQRYVYELPRVVRHWIEDFDDGTAPVLPFSFVTSLA